MSDEKEAVRAWADRWLEFLWKRADAGQLSYEQASRTTGVIVGAVAAESVTMEGGVPRARAMKRRTVPPSNTAGGKRKDPPRRAWSELPEEGWKE